jgi:hypothetical protein
VIWLDRLWDPQWSKDKVPVFRKLVADAHADDGWISDGNFALATFDLRLPRAELVVWLERSTLACAWRAVTRVFRRGEAHRLVDLPTVLAFIWNFDRANRPKIETERAAHGGQRPGRTTRQRSRDRGVRTVSASPGRRIRLAIRSELFLSESGRLSRRESDRRA